MTRILYLTRRFFDTIHECLSDTIERDIFDIEGRIFLFLTLTKYTKKSMGHILKCRKTKYIIYPRYAMIISIKIQDSN
jgi:hypothetical protein